MIELYKKNLSEKAALLMPPDLAHIPWKHAGITDAFFQGVQHSLPSSFTSLTIQHETIKLYRLSDFFSCYPDVAQKYFFHFFAEFNFKHSWSLYAHMHAQEHYVLYVPPHTICSDTFLLEYTIACIEALTIIVGEGASVRIHEYFHALAGKRIKNSDIILEQHATVDYVIEQADASSVQAYLQYRYFIYDRASIVVHCIQRSSLVRVMTLDLMLLGSGAQAHVRAGGILALKERVTFLTSQMHYAPSTQSSVIAKNVVADAAHATYYGTIHIDENATGSEAYQENKNLLIGEQAYICSQPTLEIHTNDVRCKHGSAMGRHDNEQLWYMHARGINEVVARQLLTRAFIEDIVHPGYHTTYL